MNEIHDCPDSASILLWHITTNTLPHCYGWRTTFPHGESSNEDILEELLYRTIDVGEVQVLAVLVSVAHHGLVTISKQDTLRNMAAKSPFLADCMMYVPQASFYGRVYK
jgi:hypothetical protein